jgi:dihydroorotase
MLHYYKQGKMSLEKIAEKMSHAVADCFQIKDRGYIREGYFADLVLIDMKQQTKVSKKMFYINADGVRWKGLNFLQPLHTLL